MIAVETGELLVVRFSPMGVDRFMDQAQVSMLDCESRGEEPLYSISTYGQVKGRDDTVESLIFQICDEAPVSGKKVWLVTDTTLHAEGFDIRLSEPPPHHYDVVLGTKLQVEDVMRLVKVFEPGQEVNPAWKKSSQ